MALRYRITNKSGTRNPHYEAVKQQKIGKFLTQKGMQEGIIIDGGLGDIIEGMSSL